MSRFARTVLCTAALAFWLVALPLVSTGQEVTIDSQGRPITTAPPRASSPSPSLVKPDTAIPEGTNTIYSTFGSGHSYNCCTGWTLSGPTSVVGTPFSAAMAFTPTKGTYLLTQLDLAIGYVSGTSGYKLELDADDHGKPGRKIAKWEVTGLPIFGYTSNSVETIKVKGLILLEKHHQYWLVPKVNSDEWAAWNWNSVAVSGNGLWSNDGGSTWTTIGTNPSGAFDVLGLKLF
jgi:hypothetical protein